MNARITQEILEVIRRQDPGVRATQEVLSVIVALGLRDGPAGGVTEAAGLRQIPLPLQQAVTDERGLVTLPWESFFRELILPGERDAPVPMPLQERLMDERFLVTVPWESFFGWLVKTRDDAGVLPLRRPPPVQHAMTDPRILMTVPWALFFVWLMTGFTERMPYLTHILQQGLCISQEIVEVVVLPGA
jgi:hypothetical protein